MKGKTLVAYFDRTVLEQGPTVNHPAQNMVPSGKQEWEGKCILQANRLLFVAQKIWRADQANIFFKNRYRIDPPIFTRIETNGDIKLSPLATACTKCGLKRSSTRNETPEATSDKLAINGSISIGITVNVAPKRTKPPGSLASSRTSLVAASTAARMERAWFRNLSPLSVRSTPFELRENNVTPKTGLHLTDVMAERGLGDAGLQRGFRKTSRVGDLYKVAQLAEIIIHGIYNRDIFYPYNIF